MYQSLIHNHPQGTSGLGDKKMEYCDNLPKTYKKLYIIAYLVEQGKFKIFLILEQTKYTIQVIGAS